MSSLRTARAGILKSSCELIACKQARLEFEDFSRDVIGLLHHSIMLLMITPGSPAFLHIRPSSGSTTGLKTSKSFRSSELHRASNIHSLQLHNANNIHVPSADNATA